MTSRPSAKHRHVRAVWRDGDVADDHRRRDRKRLAGETLNVQTKRLIRFAGKDQQALSIRKEPGPLIVEPGPRKLDGGALADRHEAEARAILNPERKGKFAVGRAGQGTPVT